MSTIFSYAPASFSQQEKDIDIITPSTVLDVVYIQSFSLSDGYIHYWRQEKPFIKFGTLAVFKVNPELVYPKNAAEPVLYAGDQTVERLNHGHESGYVVAIIPGELDLSGNPVWFGSPELPERVNESIIKTEREMAESAKIRALDPERILEVTQKHVDVSDLATLLRDYAAELVMKYSPMEKELAEAWRLPIAKN